MKVFLIWIFAATASLFMLACGDSAEECTPNDRTVCKEGVVHWVDSCGNQGDKAGDCDCGCNTDFSGCKTPCDCTPDCAGKCCGDNGCEGTCQDNCSLSGQTCNTDTCRCEGTCTPNCDGKCCGPDGCGGTCQDDCALSGKVCNTSTCLCEGACRPVCDGKCCGSDGCEGTCEDNCADNGQSCNTTSCLCEGTCVPDCANKDCGPDGCDGFCGSCGLNFACEEGQCICDNVVCGEVCCAEGEVCDGEACCLSDCAGKQCGTNCAGESCGTCPQGSFCEEGTFTCIIEGVEDCWNGSTCPVSSPYCLFSCREQTSRCCEILPDHPMQVDGTVDDSCEVCCTNPNFPNPVLWPDGEPSCCAVGAPYPFETCGSGEHQCCPRIPASPRQCDGTVVTTCMQCCTDSYPNPVRHPDGSFACCSDSHPYSCVINGQNSCCEDPGQCG
ncbi:MAG: hypothetical protein JRF33_01945 [Deltaproteobacteria bacterium]|nr:hypothetical protein [Deltaproteobacteria bacterium]